MNFKRQVVFGSLWSIFGNSGQQLIGFFIFIYIARTVTPADVGLVALAMVLIAILGFVSRFGQVEALQRRADLSDLAINTGFWLLFAAGLLTTAIVFAAAQGAAVVDPQLPLVLMLLAPLCALESWTAVPEAILRRRFAFRSLSLRNWIAALSGGALGIYLAYRGYGVYALVAQRLGTAAVQTVATWAFLRWHPRFAFSWTEARELLRTGTDIMIAGLAGQLNFRIADALTGTMVGVASLGFLRLGWRFFEVLITLGVNPVTNVALSTFSRIQKDLPALRRAYLRLTQFMAAGALPMFFGLAVVADVLVPLVFGEKWQESIIVLQLLAFVGLASTVNSFFGPVMIAVGKSRVVLFQSIVQVIATVVFIYIGAHFGIVGVMIAFIVRAMFVAAYNLVALSKEVGIDVGLVVRTVAPPAFSCIVMVVIVELVKLQLAGSMSGILLLALLVAIGSTTYAATLAAGDFIGLWRGYVRDAVASVTGAFARRVPKATEAAA